MPLDTDEERAEYLSLLKPIKKFNKCYAADCIRHAHSVVRNVSRSGGDNTETICALLSYLYFTEEDEGRKVLILKSMWFGRRMSQKLEEYRKCRRK